MSVPLYGTPKKRRRNPSTLPLVILGFFVFLGTGALLFIYLPNTPSKVAGQVTQAGRRLGRRLGGRIGRSVESGASSTRAAYSTLAATARDLSSTRSAGGHGHMLDVSPLHPADVHSPRQRSLAPSHPSPLPGRWERPLVDARRDAQGGAQREGQRDAAHALEGDGSAGSVHHPSGLLQRAPSVATPHAAASPMWVPRPCEDHHENCGEWASKGECKANPSYMLNSCPKSCNDCETFLDKQRLCHRTIEKRPLLRAGGVHTTFERLITLLSPTHEVRVHSRPPKGPWVVTIDNFLSEAEVRAMVEKGGHHFERSLAGDGVSPVRTSKTSWCNVPFCENDPTIKSIKARVANVTGVPLANSEHVQVLHYDAGDFYKQHHDQNANPRSPWGPRLFTFFIYLSNVERGGGTRFTRLNITVEPKPGRALFWPSVMDDDPSAIRRHEDERTTHEALTVEQGVKLAANMWLHQYDFQNTLAAGCKNQDLALCGDCEQPEPS